MWTLDTGKNTLFRRVNRALRTGEGLDDLQPFIDAMRGGLGKLPTFEGTVYRSVKERPMGNEGYRQFMEDHQPGNIVTYAGFTAASKKTDQVLRGRLKFTLWSKSGVDISAFSNKPGQEEILIAPGAQFQVLKQETRPSGAIDIWLQQI